MVLANAPLCEGFAANGTGVRTPHGKTHFAADFGAPAPGARTWDRLEIDMSEPKKHAGKHDIFPKEKHDMFNICFYHVVGPRYRPFECVSLSRLNERNTMDQLEGNHEIKTSN